MEEEGEGRHQWGCGPFSGKGLKSQEERHAVDRDNNMEEMRESPKMCIRFPLLRGSHFGLFF